ncbi:MAG: peptidylprolyl isomerase [Candidatus Zixiibacteriota bacterium]
MLKAMRKLTKHIMWFVIVAFVGTIIFAWGMDLGSRKQRRGVIASINGEEIELYTFQYYYDQALRQAEKEQGDVDDQTAIQIRDEVFNNLLNDVLLNQEAAKRRIEVTDTEMYEYMRRYPPPELREHPAFQTPEGEFDYQKYVQALADPRVPWDQVEQMIRPNLRMGKLQQAILSLVRVTDSEAERFYRDENEKVNVEYLLVPAYEFQRQNLSLSDQSIEAYYQDNRDEFQTDPSANLSYVFFEKKPSQADEDEIKERLVEIKEEILEGEDFAGMAEDYSDDVGSGKDGGNLGWFGKGAMVEAFEQTAFSLEPGEISEPVKTQFGWHLIKVEEKRGEGDDQEVRASHILLKITPSDATLDMLKETSEDFADRVRKSELSEMAEGESLSVSETGWFTQEGHIPGIGRNIQVDEFAFEKGEGTVSDLIETARGFYVFQIKEKRPAGISPLDQAEQVIRQKLTKIMADSLAYDKAEKIYAQIKGGESLKKAAEESDATYANPDGFARNSPPQQVGRSPEFIGAAFSLTEPKQLSPPVKASQGTFIIQLVSRTLVDDSLFAAVKDSISFVVLQQKQGEAYQDWFSQVKKQAEIKDYRAEYFRDVGSY